MPDYTKKDFKLLLDDLRVYCGGCHITITGTYRPDTGNGVSDGVIRIRKDPFSFTTTNIRNHMDYWAIGLPVPAACMIGDRRTGLFCFPKIHRDPELSERYRIANGIQFFYSFSSRGISEEQRLRDFEKKLGYERIRSPKMVLARIKRDFRSFKPPCVRQPTRR